FLQFLSSPNGSHPGLLPSPKLVVDLVAFGPEIDEVKFQGHLLLVSLSFGRIDLGLMIGHEDRPFLHKLGAFCLGALEVAGDLASNRSCSALTDSTSAEHWRC